MLRQYGNERARRFDGALKRWRLPGLIAWMTAMAPTVPAMGDVLERSPPGAADGIIAAPAMAADSSRAGGAASFGQQAFDERQHVRLEQALDLDPAGPGPEDVPAGTVVSSHMIFLNVPDGAPGASELVTWTLGGRILGVMSDYFGQLEAASTALLGAPDTRYQAPFPARGMEGEDDYAFRDNQIAVYMLVRQPGDWIRVITAEPAVAAAPMVQPPSRVRSDATRRQHR